MKATLALGYFYLLALVLISVGVHFNRLIEIPIAILMVAIVTVLYLTRPRMNG